MVLADRCPGWGGRGIPGAGRDSWSPTTPDLTPHLEAWYELIHVAAGHEPEIATPIELTSVVR